MSSITKALPDTGASHPNLERSLRSDLEGEVAFDDYTRHLFSRDASMYSITPVGVVFPRHTDDVAAAVKAAAEHGVPLIPAARRRASPDRRWARAW